jgi:serine/threonine-protein kinase
VKVLDFGIARVLGEDPAVTRLTTTGALLGTPAYMSPEQLFGEAFDHRADIWALGIMAFEVLTSVLPTRGANVGQILKVLMGGTSWKASDVVPAVPEAVSDIVAKMLSRAPDARPADLREVFDVLSQHSTRLEPRFGPPMSRSAERAAQRSG